MTWRLSDRTIELGRPIGAGIVNVTSDSMFSGARSETPEGALADGRALADAGFDMLDVGAVAARSGPEVAADDEASRLIPAIEGLAGATDLPISADTFSTEVAARALDAGAVAINDISGGADTALFELAAKTECGLVLMAIDGPPRHDREPARHEDPIEHLRAFFSEKVDEACTLGVQPEQIVLDPGLDFDLSVADDLEILRRLGELGELGRPLYVSLSRKDFLGAALAGSWEERRPAEELEWASAAATTLAVWNGGLILRLHDASALQAMRIAGEARAHG